VKDGKTFLDLIAEQVKFMRREYGSNVKFILMNSFSTSADTRAFLSKAHKDLLEVFGLGDRGNGLVCLHFAEAQGTPAPHTSVCADLYALPQEPHIELMQNMSPKVDAATLAPAAYPQDTDLEWCARWPGGSGGAGRQQASRSLPNTNTAAALLFIHPILSCEPRTLPLLP
jgi:UTP--glucose-1-phosphate uridylyltransferase